MQKIHELRAYLVDYVPELKADPARLLMHVTDGHVAARYGENLGFQYHFTLALTVLNYTKHQDTIFLPLVVWLRNHMPDALLNHDIGNQLIRFEVDVIDTETVDIAVTIKMHETVDVLPDGDGRYNMSHRAEPAILGTEGLEGLAQLPDDVLLLINQYGEYLLNPAGDLLMPPSGA